MPPTSTNPTANQQSIQWSVSPNTVTSLSLSSITTPVTKPPRQSHKSGSPPMIHFDDFPTEQGSPTPEPVAIPVPKSTPRFSLPPRLHRRTKSPVAKVTQSTQATQATRTKPAITIPQISTVPGLAHLALRLAKQHGPVVMIAASIRQQAAQSISRALRFWYSRQSVDRLRSASLIEQRKQHLYATYVQSKFDLFSKHRYRVVGSEPSGPPKVPKGYFTNINVEATTDSDVQEAINNQSRRLIITVDAAKEILAT